jgi:hypothetical protein
VRGRSGSLGSDFYGGVGPPRTPMEGPRVSAARPLPTPPSAPASPRAAPTLPRLVRLLKPQTHEFSITPRISRAREEFGVPSLQREDVAPSRYQFDSEAVQPFVDKLVHPDRRQLTSLWERICFYSNFQLDKHCVEDLGVDLVTSANVRKRFRIVPTVLDELSEMIVQLEPILANIGQILPHSLFTSTPVDPGGHLLRSLGGLPDLRLLHYNFTMLVDRMALAADRVRLLDSTNVLVEDGLSSVQTGETWARDLERTNAADLPAADISKLYLRHPQVAKLLGNEEERSIRTWVNDVGAIAPPTPAGSFLRALEPERALVDAFPARLPEARPKRMYYHLDQDEPTYAFASRRSSVGQSASWCAPTRGDGSTADESEVTRILGQDDNGPRRPTRGRPSIVEGALARSRPNEFLNKATVNAARSLPTAPAAPRRRSLPLQAVMADAQRPPLSAPVPTSPTRALASNMPATIFDKPPDFSDVPSSGSSSSDSDDGRGGRGGGGGGGGNGPRGSGPASSAPHARRKTYPDRLRLDPKVNLKDFKKWDGGHGTAIDYFYDVQRIAELGSQVSRYLARYLPSTLESGSPALNFYDTLSPKWKRYMRSNWLRFVYVLKQYFLTDRWVSDMMDLVRGQRFRQRGYETELPIAFINRRVRYIRVLGLAEPGSPLEVTEVLRKTPPGWKSVLDLSSLTMLLSSASYHWDQLVDLARVPSASSSGMRFADSDLGGLERALKRLGYTPSSTNNRPFVHRRALGPPGARTAAIAGASSEVVDDSDGEGDGDDEAGSDGVESIHEEALKEIFVNLRKSAPQGPKTYQYAKRNNIKTALGRKPPYPCRQCGSANHWNKECPFYDLYKKQASRAGNLVEQDPMYVDAYAHSINKAVSKAYDGVITPLTVISRDLPEMDAFLHSRRELKWDGNVPGPAREILAVSSSVPRPSFKKTTITDVEEEEPEDLFLRLKPKAVTGIIEDFAEDDSDVLAPDLEQWGDTDSEDELEDPVIADSTTSHNVNQTPLENSWEDIAECSLSGVLAEAPDRDEPLFDIPRLDQARGYEPGRSAAGVSVLSTQGWLGSPDESLVDLRLDSCADVTLLSQDFYDRMTVKPKLQRGLKMRLWQLTDKKAQIAGYVNLPVIMRTNTGQLVRMEAEAYVVPNMSVDVLLGEDFQLNYAIGVSRDPSRNPIISFLGYAHEVEATPVGQCIDSSRVLRTSMSTQTYVRAAAHRRNKGVRQRARRKLRLEAETEVRASEDFELAPESVRKVRVEGQFGDDPGREFVVERNLLLDGEDAWLAVAPTLLVAAAPFVPVANLSKLARRVKKGDLIGYKGDPQNYFDTPKTDEDERTMRAHAERIAAFVRCSMDAESNTAQAAPEDPSSRPAEMHATSAKESVPVVGARDGQPEQRATPPDEDYGPKTAELPDDERYDSSRLEEILDVGDVPDDLKEDVWAMLRKRAGAFGFDDRLGKHATKIRIRVREEQPPISAPMYGASSEKRRVVEEQVRKWLEQEVIEPSRSPWGAPVVIAYRNGKARFCVDYRKLNAATISDEFPIPRQSDIMAALSGAQVLSTLDALSGFLQLEVHPDDVEKTAFRTHLGLFQFLRMPFGLRNGPAIFQRVMQEILSPFLWIFCLVYIDDIVVYSKTMREHLHHLDLVLEAVERAGITLSPKKCHLFYSSILLLGHKVSRLGLSTHDEKVSAILDLQPPTKVSELQTFLGMIVYFSTFIPFYASIARPLFSLLRKDVRWRWGSDEQYAFDAAKAALRSSPVLGHPIQGLPYRLYTDASDEALGCALQQVQPIRVGDLQGTKAYDRLRQAYAEGQPPPKLVIALSAKIVDAAGSDSWSDSLDESIMRVERVVAYWSRTFKGPETRYSATEREALAAKEGLVKFQPFIEGEEIALVTDHAALQWARTYENTNRRLAAWGAVFAAYSKLQIVHRPGRVHSNVDPLSRLPRAAPEFVAPRIDPTAPIVLEYDADDSRFRSSGTRVNALHTTVTHDQVVHFEANAANARPQRTRRAPERTTFQIPGRDVPKKPRAKARGPVKDRSPLAPSDAPPAKPTQQPSRAHARGPPSYSEIQPEQPAEYEQPEDAPFAEETFPAAPDDYSHFHKWEHDRPLPYLHVHMHPKIRETWINGYMEDAVLKRRWENPDAKADFWRPGRRYYKDELGLLFFCDADFIPRLVVPRSMVPTVLREAHESPVESAHAGAERLWLRLKELYFWPRMKKDVETYADSCDIC